MSFSVSITTRAIEALDYIPLVSTGKSLIELFVKYAVLPKLTSQAIIQSSYYTLVDDTSLCRLIIVALPLLGNVTIALFDLARHFLVTKEAISSASYTYFAPLYAALAPHSLMHDKKLAAEVLTWYPSALGSFGRDIREDREIRHIVTIKKAIEFDVEFLNGFPIYGSPEEQEEFKDEFAQKVWSQIAPDLKDDLQIQARYYGLTPWTLPAESRKNKAFIHQLLDADDCASNLYPYLDETLRLDPDIAFKSYCQRGFHDFDPDLRQNKDFAEKIVKEYIGNVRHFPELIQDKDFWITILNFEKNKILSSLKFLEHLPQNLQKDPEIIDLVRQAYIKGLEIKANISEVDIEFKEDIFLNRDPQILQAYRTAFIRTSSNNRPPYFGRKYYEYHLLLRDADNMSPYINCEGYKNAKLKQLKALSDRAIVTKYFDWFIHPHFEGDQELKQALNAYADRFFRKK